MKLPKMKNSNVENAELLGRVRATVALLKSLQSSGYAQASYVIRILNGADSYDVYGRVCAFVGYMESNKYPYDFETAAYRAILGEDFLEQKDEPEHEASATQDELSSILITPEARASIEEKA